MNIAIIDDQDDIKYAIEKILTKQGHTCYGFSGNEEDLIEGLNVFEVDLIILDMMLEDNLTGLDVIETLRNQEINTPIIMITAYTTPSNMIKASKAGIIDIIQKPFSANDIVQTVERYSSISLPKTLSLNSGEEEFIGSFETMKEIYKNIGMAANNSSNVLIVGETGTGKELIARLIHKNSTGANEPFVAINCATIPENLFEKLMYGKVENFSKNQNEAHLGYVQKVGRGTLFLDEISELHPNLQVKLLRFLETKSFYPLGSNDEIKFHGRIIAASLKRQNELDEGSFRKDLYFRISTFEIFVPCLNQRKNDIKALCFHFIKQICSSLNMPEKNIEEDAIAFLQSCTLNGNVRELKNIIYKSVLHSRNELICKQDLNRNINKNYNDKKSLLKEMCKELSKNYTIQHAQELFEDFEKEMLQTLLKECNNISQLSTHLGITRNTLKAKLKKYGIET
ncbi:MAG: sigma-54 dependent transcriptional regulator [Sulfurimonadaceae bacterium]|jgi:DNA-binding NtrC family response regulator|nr:sigma-54 dependent transcriptional regulator [Arcobacteraceae bacterium]MDX9796052.1 sigma-54 dependent transcriptional regulator [Arcobacteraceae bacterium]